MLQTILQERRLKQDERQLQRERQELLEQRRKYLKTEDDPIWDGDIDWLKHRHVGG